MQELLTMVAGYAGWVGALGTMAAYGLVSQRRLAADSLRYAIVNALGAALLAASARSVGNWPSLFANLVWMSIGVVSLARSRTALVAAVARRMPAAPRHAPRKALSTFS